MVEHHGDPAESDAVGERALVLGGGGSAGNAWLIGVVAGLSEAGLQVTDAELVVGTSAGSTAAVQISGATAADLLAQILSAAPPPRTGPGGPAGGPVPARPTATYLETTGALISASADAADMRRRIGGAALAASAASDGSAGPRWRATVATRLPTQRWPDRRVLITAVDAETGDPVVFDRDSGVEVVDAVAASCSSAVAYRIGDHRYIDGGYRRNENADLAVGFRRVLVLSPFGGRSRHPLEWGMQLAAQIEELRAGGSTVETVFPDARSLSEFGDDVMDPSRRAPAARAGYEQGLALAEHLAEFWR
jgi:NTE family protein